MADPYSFLRLDQSLLGQQHRLVKLSTSLGQDILLPQRVIAHERLGRSYEYTVDCLSVRSDIELKELIAQPVTLWILQADRSYLPVHGYVHRMKRLGSDGQLTFCQMSFGPWLYFLKFRKDARIWQEKTADDILVDVFNEHPQAQGNFRFELAERASQRSYCTQYETDWHFVQRLMEEEGWYSYHEQKADGSGHVLVITDTTDRLKPIPQEYVQFHGAGTEDELNKILHWSAARSLASTQFTSRTDDYKAPYVPKESNTFVEAEHGALPGQLEIYEYTGAYTYSRREQGDKQSRLRVEQWESSIKRFSAVSGVRSLPVGHWFTLEDHPAHRSDSDDDRQFLVIAVEWCIENNLPLSNNGKHFPGSLAPQLEAAKAALGRKGTQGVDSLAGNEHTGHCFNRMEVQRRRVPFRSPFDIYRSPQPRQSPVSLGPAKPGRRARVLLGARQLSKRRPGLGRIECAPDRPGRHHHLPER
jgi:type VI secretion system secreted protein VgrG